MKMMGWKIRDRGMEEEGMEMEMEMEMIRLKCKDNILHNYITILIPI